MTAQTTVSGKGQIVIPKDVRERLGFHAGQRLELVEMAGGVLLKAADKKSGRSFDEIAHNIRTVVAYCGAPVSIAEMNDTIDESWRRAGIDSDQ